MKWTKEECAKEAAKYNNRKEFSNNNHWAYQKSLEKGWADEICQHMVIICHPNNTWTEEKCLSLTSEYTDLRTFKENHRTVADKIKMNGWDYMLEHMTPVINEKIWTKEKCVEIAQKYNTKKEFRAASECGYRYALKSGIMDEVSAHMKPLGNSHKRCVYVCYFEDKSVYVGLTYDFDKRKTQHMSTQKHSTVRDHIIKTGTVPKMVKISDYIPKKGAVELEKDTVEKFKTDGYNILNKAKTGGTGGDTLIWTKENCLIAANMCKSKKEFRKNYCTAYNYSRKNNWDYPHLIEDTTKPNGYWTKERCAEIASNYTILKDFRTNEQAAYGAACNYGFREEICAHMKRKTN